MTLNLFVYLLLSFFSLLIGLLYFKNKTKSLLLFLFFGLLLPTSNEFMFVTSFQGVYFYDYYFLLITLFYILSIKISDLKKIIRDNKIILLIIGTLIIYYTYLIIINSINFDKYLLRDFRPFLCLLSALIFIESLKNIRIRFKLIVNIFFYVLILKLLLFMVLFLLNPFEDPYYQRYLFRYRDGTTFSAALFLIIFLFKKQDILLYVSKFRLNVIVILSMLVLIVSNLRSLLLAFLLVYFIVHKTNSNNLFRKIMVTLIFICSFVGYTYLGEHVLANFHNSSLDQKKFRITKMGKVHYRMDELFTNLDDQIFSRFSPAMPTVKQMTNLEIFVGKGFATTFTIPWFKYRGLDTKHNQIDSTYITFFVKYGLVGLILILILCIKIIIANIHDKPLKNSIVSFYLIIFLFMSTLYQPGAIIHLVFINMFMCSLYQKDSISSPNSSIC